MKVVDHEYVISAHVPENVTRRYGNPYFATEGTRTMGALKTA